MRTEIWKCDIDQCDKNVGRGNATTPNKLEWVYETKS